LEREIEGGKEVVSVSGLFVASCAEGVAEPKIPNMRGIMSARTKPLQVIEGKEIEKLSEITSFETPTPRGTVKLVPTEQTETLIDLLHQEAKVI
ncbi:MAG: electron transfer flavoprotein subunit alpha, partial [Pedobacter sp.]|nr:electron transfer flavoprotein subunit alpha [Pedobacter sp.]